MTRKKIRADWIQIGGDSDYPSDEGVFAPQPESDWPDEVKIVRIVNEFARGGDRIYQVVTSYINCKDVMGKNGEKIRRQANIDINDWEKMNCHKRAYVAEDIGNTGYGQEEANLGKVFEDSFGRDARVEDMSGKVVTSRDWDDMWADSEG